MENLMIRTNNFLYWIDIDSHLEEDERLARALQESLNTESPPRYGNGNGNSYQPFQPRYGNESDNLHKPCPPQYGNGNGNSYLPFQPRYGNEDGKWHQPYPPRYGNGYGNSYHPYQPAPVYYPMGSRYMII